MNNSEDLIPKPTNCIYMDIIDKILSICFILKCFHELQFSFFFFPSENFCCLQPFLGHRGPPGECFGSRLCCGQQLHLQLGFLKRSKSRLLCSAPATKQATLPWESESHRAFLLFPLPLLRVIKGKATAAPFSKYVTHKGTNAWIQSSPLGAETDCGKLHGLN